MLKRTAFTAAFAAALLIACASVVAHGGLNRADPAPGAALGASPKSVRLFFTEPPEPTLSDIAVVDFKGAAYQISRPQAVADDPLSLTVPLRRLERGVYIVNWRVVSAVDGHTTSGSYAFGIGVVPTTATISSPAIPPPTPLEIGARWLLLTGLVVLTGASVAAAARFGGVHDLALATAGWSATMIGLALVVVAQIRSAGITVQALMSVAIGRALIWRALAVAVAGIALLTARLRPERRREALGVAAMAAAVAIAVHAAAGHAATNTGWRLAFRVFAQWAHVVAIGVWLGGLLALLAGIRGEPSDTKAIAIGRFSRLAGFALAIVVATGLARTYGELAGWRDLIATDYGTAVLLKIGATVVIAAVAAINRWHSVVRARFTLTPLRRAGSAELGLATVALLAAAALGTLPPPASGFVAPRSLRAAGSDFGTSVRVELTTESDQPGPNQFTIRARDYDSRAPVIAATVTLQFAPMDDPDVPGTSLALEQTRDGTYTGTGANLAFDGRWQVTAVIQRGADSVSVPLQLDVAGPAIQVLPRREASGKPFHVAIVPYAGLFRIDLDPEHAGPSTLTVSCYDPRIFEPRPIDSLVVTHEASGAPVQPLSLRRLNQFQFASDIVLSAGANRIVAITHGADGSRTRTAFDITIAR
jgi:copper transport protein